jgi:hypothetical protein
MLHRSTLSFAAIVVGLCASSSASAANRFFINNASIPIGSTGNTISILADLDQPVYGFSVHLTFDAAKVRVTGVQAGSAVSALAPEYNDGTFTNSPGRVVWGVVFDLSNPITKNLAVGTNKEILKLTVDALSASTTTVLLDLVNSPGNPSRLNVMTNANGDSVSPPPTLVDGTLSLTSLAPSIQDISPSSGPAGVDIVISGQNLNQPGLAVTICGKAATFGFLGDNQTITATAPACGAGPAEVKVCTNFGCDSEPAGFTYSAGDQPPVIDTILDNTGVAGKVFDIVGQNFGVSGLSVMVCNVNATFTLLGDGGTIEVTAPACAATGCAVVKVTTSAGSDSEPCGFTYQGSSGVFIRGNVNGDSRVDLSDAVSILNYLFAGGTKPACLDAADTNDTGVLDLSDAVFMLNFLFQGGAKIKPPYPDAGTDPTADAFPSC